MIELDERAHLSEVNNVLRLLFVLNRHASGIGDPERLGLDLVARAQEAGAEAHSLVTLSESELWEALQDASSAGERVVLVGGDGSLHAAANAPMPELPELALIPSGRANNVAHALGIPTDRAGALAVATGATTRPLDALRVQTPEGSIYAVEGVSAGFHAAARSMYDAENSSDLRQGLSAFSHAVHEFAPYRLRGSLDEQELDIADTAQLFLSNLPLFAYGFHVDPGADPADGRLEAIIFQARRRTTLLRLLAEAYRAHHIGKRGVRRVSAQRVELTASLPLVADAVPLGTTTATVTVEPARLRIAAPPEGGMM